MNKIFEKLKYNISKLTLKSFKNFGLVVLGTFIVAIAVELFILIGCGIYNIISNYMKSIDIWNPRGDGNKQILFSTLVSGTASVILYAVLSGNYQINNLALYFISFVVIFFFTRLIMIAINKKKLQTLDKKLNDDDNIE